VGRLMDGYGHIKPISELLGSVKLCFLDRGDPIKS